MGDEPEHLKFLQMALSEAHRCVPTTTAFCVGCVLVVRWPDRSASPTILARGHSRELPGNTHAEANALTKARSLTYNDLADLLPSVSPCPSIDELLAHTDVYTTLEPCSIRTSGLAPCADALISAKVPRCFIGVGEPPDFVNCEGAQKLKDAGVKVTWVDGLENECLSAAKKGH